MAERKMSQIQCDVVFAPAGSCVLANLQTRVPIVYFSDATFRLMIDYYSNFSNAFPSHVRVADELERAAIEKAKQLIYPSSWAAESAIRDYGAAESKVNVVPLGANFETPPSREAALHPMVLDQCRLLFVGVDWDQKGGQIAFETLLELERLGIPAELTIVGCEPPATVKHDKLAVFRFLNKNNPQERAKIEQLYRDATFFILPTRAECFGIVSCEANAYGLPVLSTKTGGVPDVVRDGVNGFLFPLEARGDQYALRIRDIFNDAATYNRLRMTSRDEFDTRLNWDTWGERVKDILWAAVAPDSVARPGR